MKSFYMNLNKVKWRGRILRVIRINQEIVYETTLEGDVRSNGIPVYDAGDACLGYAYSPRDRLCIRTTPPPERTFPLLCIRTSNQDEMIFIPNGVLVTAYRQERHVVHDPEAYIESIQVDSGETILLPSFSQLLRMFRKETYTWLKIGWSTRFIQHVTLNHDVDETFISPVEYMATGTYWKSPGYKEVFTPVKDGVNDEDCSDVSSSDEAASSMDESDSERT